MKTPTIAIVSGGLDSTVLAYWLKASRHRELIGLVSVNYGQRHAKELCQAAFTAGKLDVPHHLVDLSTLSKHLNRSSLTSTAEVPEGHYAEESMKATVVPNRNMILIAVATGIALTEKASVVAYGAHAGDHAIYPDCRPIFADAMGYAMSLCDYNPPRLERPFISKTKADLVKEGILLGVDFRATWTCYKGGNKACGKCGTCVERLEAFSLNGVEDPLEYEDRESWKELIKQASAGTHTQLPLH